MPEFQLSDDGLALVVQRFDLKSDGSYLGYEDFCVLNGLPTADKYKGSYETRLFKRARQFIDIDQHKRALEDLFKLFVLNCAIRNGDAHLKNFGIVYADVTGPAGLAPIYDLVSTQPYLPKDPMALTLNGSTNWPDGKALTLLGQTRCDLSSQTIKRVLDETADALSKIAPDVVRYFKNTVVHRDIGFASLRHGTRAFNTVSGLPIIQSQKPATPDSDHCERCNNQCQVPALISLRTPGTSSAMNFATCGGNSSVICSPVGAAIVRRTVSRMASGNTRARATDCTMMVSKSDEGASRCERIRRAQKTMASLRPKNSSSVRLIAVILPLASLRRRMKPLSCSVRLIPSGISRIVFSVGHAMGFSPIVCGA